MCNPGILLAASTAVGAIGNIQEGNAQARAYNYTAAVNEQNAVFAETRAMDAIARGAEEEQRIRREGGAVRGRQVAQMAASGVDVGFGSPLDILTDTAIGVKLDAARARRNAQREAEDMDTQAWNYRAQAGLDRQGARNARAGGVMGAIGTVLGGAGRLTRYRTSVNIG